MILGGGRKLSRPPASYAPVMTVQVRRKRKATHQLNSETQQMHSINKLDIFFTYTANICLIISLLIL